MSTSESYVEDVESFEAFGYRCTIRRNNIMGGALLGYIDVPQGHPWHGHRLDDDLVHGGVT